MRHIVPLIWDAVRSDVEGGQEVDVEAYCRHYCALRPDIQASLIRNAVVEAVSACGGVAAGGMNGRLDRPS